MVHFVGAGSGAADLITMRGKKLRDGDFAEFNGERVIVEG